MSIESENGKVKIQSEITEKIKKLNWKLTKILKKKFLEVENLRVKLSYLVKINTNLKRNELNKY